MTRRLNAAFEFNPAASGGLRQLGDYSTDPATSGATATAERTPPSCAPLAEGLADAANMGPYATLLMITRNSRTERASNVLKRPPCARVNASYIGPEVAGALRSRRWHRA